MEDIDFANWAAQHEQKPSVAQKATTIAPVEDDGFIASLQKWASKWESKPKPQQQYQPTVGGARKRPSAFTFKRGDVRGNLQQILSRAEAQDYITLAGGRKVRELPQMTVAEIGRQFGNKAAGKYQIQRNTAVDVLKERGIDPEAFRFDQRGQEQLFDMLLQRRGFEDFKAGKKDKVAFAKELAKEWAGLPKDESGLSFYHGLSGNKAHVKWQDILAALD